MKKQNKRTLQGLKIESFVTTTSLESMQTVRGGWASWDCDYTTLERNACEEMRTALSCI